MRNRMRQACFLSKVIVFCSVVGWFSIETSSAPLRSPIFRSQRLDYWIADPLAPEGYSYPLRMDSIRLGDFDGDGRQDLLVVNEPCHYVDGGIYVIRLSEGGDVSSTSGTPVREA